MRPTGPRSVWRCWRPCPEAGRARALTVPLCVPRAVSCHCNCGASGPASSWYHGLTKCPKGAATPQEWLDTFQLKEAAGKPAKGKGKKNAEASSKASTPTKDGENAENAAADEEHRSFSGGVGGQGARRRRMRRRRRRMYVGWEVLGSAAVDVERGVSPTPSWLYRSGCARGTARSAAHWAGTPPRSRVSVWRGIASGMPAWRRVWGRSSTVARRRVR